VPSPDSRDDAIGGRQKLDDDGGVTTGPGSGERDIRVKFEDKVRPMVGVILVLVASLGFTAMGAFTKVAMDAERLRTTAWVALMTVIAWRSLGVAVLAGGVAVVRRHSLIPTAPKLILLRSVAGFASMCLYFGSLAFIPLGVATALIYTSPVFTVLLAERWTGEAPTPGARPWVFVAFGGVLLLALPGDGGLSGPGGPLWTGLGLAGCLLAGLLSSIAYLAVRQVRGAAGPTNIVFWYAIFAAVVSLPMSSLFFETQAEGIAPLQWTYVGLALSATIGHFTIVEAYARERAAIVAPLSYSAPVFTYLLGLASFPDETFTVRAAVGIALVIVSGAALARLAARPRAAPERATELPSPD
jgi:drug/metabolite transporter (DMT)-like permease